MKKCVLNRPARVAQARFVELEHRVVHPERTGDAVLDLKTIRPPTCSQESHGRRPNRQNAKKLKQLHASQQPLVLPTVWDVWSAGIAASAGFSALTLGSHPLAAARGSQDGEHQTLEEVLAAVRPIIDGVELPVSVDLEAGYGREPAELECRVDRRRRCRPERRGHRP